MTNQLATILDENENNDVSQDQLAEEHRKRTQAEADAQQLAAKLQVLQTQFAEYMLEQSRDVGAFAQELAKALEQPASIDSLVDHLRHLKDQLGNAASEASHNAAQAKAESERLVKRSLADLGTGEDSEAKRPRDSMNIDEEQDGGDDVEAEQQQGNGSVATDEVMVPVSQAVNDHAHDAFTERAKYIPLRLTAEERRLLRLLEAALHVSEYTDKVDVLSYRNKNQRVHAQIKDLCAILCGLTVAQNFKRGQQLIGDREFADLADFFSDCFEVGRRFKIMNPDKMRETYGKLQYMLMDSVEPDIQELLQFKCVRPLKTVYATLEEGGALAMLDDPTMEVATMEITAGNLSRNEIQKRIKAKERARDALAKKYRTKTLGEEELLRCLYSISDNNSYLAFNRDPIDKMIEYLKQYFQPTASEAGFSLSISGGSEGARLTHSHERQYTYVLQSLTLWREIQNEMFKLWYCADTDMLSERNYYRLQNTGQGLNRVQSAPNVGRSMQAILSRCQRRIGSWVGSSVVHLGDHNVPNALYFIDKYTQVPRILTPLVLVLEELPKLAKDPAISAYIAQTFGSVELCKKTILCDFFRHAFDGSGADNFFDAGSCIDGRLTSAWNWCSKLEKKKYYHVFRLVGFVSFDGDFK